MKIIFDNDATVTDFNKFVDKTAIPWFRKKYGLEIVYPDKLEIEDILDIQNTLMKKGSSIESAKSEKERMLNQFWTGIHFFKYTLFSKLRPGVRKTIKTLYKCGHEIEIHTSRSKTADKGIIGHIARRFTIYQYWLNGVFLPSNKFKFYLDDDEKVRGVISAQPQIVFEDKPEIIERLRENNIKLICVAGKHNRDITIDNNVKVIKNFEYTMIEDSIIKLVGKDDWEYYQREAHSEPLYLRLKRFKLIVFSIYHPIVLNGENIIRSKENGIIYASNHRSTLAPIIITAVLKESIHWVALLRFFNGEDSIFNNNKNPILRKITAYMFKRLEFFPIQRKADNPKVSNIKAIKDMVGFLKINCKIGIFGEGTTHRPEGKEFGQFDYTFLRLAKKTNAYIQPITLLWFRDHRNKKRIIVNFGKAFQVGSMDLEKAKEYFMNIQIQCLNENKLYISINENSVN